MSASIGNDELRDELNSGKPLFSIQVDDVLVQEIFQQLSKQINEQNVKIAKLEEELANRTRKDEFEKIVSCVSQLQQDYSSSSSTLSKTVEQFYSSLDKQSNSVNVLLQTKLNEMLFSVNAAIRGQISALGIDPIAFQGSLDKINELNLKMAKLNGKVDDLNESVIQIASGIDGSAKIENLSKKTVGTVVRNASNRNRDEIKSINERLKESNQKIETLRNELDTLFPENEAISFSAPMIFNRKQIIEFPSPPEECSMYDILSYVSAVLPSIENGLKDLHSYILQIDSKVDTKANQVDFDKEKKEVGQTISTLAEQTNEYKIRKNTYVSQNNFDELADTLFQIVNGISSSSAASTKCVACGKSVQRVTGSITTPRVATSRSRASTALTNPILNSNTSNNTITPHSIGPSVLLKLDGLEVDSSSIDIKRIHTARSQGSHRSGDSHF